MALVALVLSLLVATVGALGVVSPTKLLGLVRRFQSPAGLYGAAVFRVLLGAALFVTAPASRAPGAVRVAGAVILVSGLVTPFFGVERFRKILDWWSARGPVFIRVWAVFALALGLLLSFAVAP
jgi:hypothetical protein